MTPPPGSISIRPVETHSQLGCRTSERCDCWRGSEMWRKRLRMAAASGQRQLRAKSMKSTIAGVQQAGSTEEVYLIVRRTTKVGFAGWRVGSVFERIKHLSLAREHAISLRQKACRSFQCEKCTRSAAVARTFQAQDSIAPLKGKSDNAKHPL